MESISRASLACRSYQVIGNHSTGPSLARRSYWSPRTSGYQSSSISNREGEQTWQLAAANYERGSDIIISASIRTTYPIKSMENY